MNAFPLPVMAECGYEIGKTLSDENKRQIAKFNPSVIHVTVPDLVNLEILDYAKEHNIPLMATWHSNYIEYMDYYEAQWIKQILLQWMRHTYSFVPRLLVPTKFIKESLSNEYYQLDKCTKIGIWGRGVDTNKFSPSFRTEAARAVLGFKPTDVVVLFVGRLVKEKHCDIYIDVMNQLSSQRSNVRGLVVGEGEYKKRMGAIPNTKTTGWLKDDSLSTAYAICDVFLFPSGSETFGNVTLEACASGLPIVVEEGCSSHLVSSEFPNGFTVKRNDKKRFYEVTLELCDDKQMRQRYGENSRKFIQTKYECQDVIDEMRKIYEEEEAIGAYINSCEDDNEANFPWGRVPVPFVLWCMEWFFWIFVRGTVWVVWSLLFFRTRLGRLLSFYGRNRTDEEKSRSKSSSSNSSSSSGSDGDTKTTSNKVLDKLCSAGTEVAIFVGGIFGTLFTTFILTFLMRKKANGSSNSKNK